MIIDCHGHYTTAPQDLTSFRDAQIAALKDPAARQKMLSRIPLRRFPDAGEVAEGERVAVPRGRGALGVAPVLPARVGRGRAPQLVRGVDVEGAAGPGPQLSRRRGRAAR